MNTTLSESSLLAEAIRGAVAIERELTERIELQRPNAHPASTNDARPETPDATDSDQGGATVSRP
jgi:hypothetical protein